MDRILISVMLILSVTLTLQAEYAIGETPPDFTCSDTYSNSWNLYEQRGKVVLLNFGATW